MYSARANTSGIERFLKHATKEMKREISYGVRDQLVIIERQHKTKETNRGGRDRAVKGRWTSRTGEGSKSFHRDYQLGRLIGKYGSDSRRMAKVEDGGEIKPKGKYLTIPTKNAPRGVWARYVGGLFFINSKAGNPLLVKSDGAGGLIVMYILRKSVKLPPRPSLKRAIKNTEKKRERIMDDHIEKVLGYR